MKLKITTLDLEAIRKIEKCGFLCRDASDGLFLESGDEITEFRLKRLLDLGVIAPSGDSLFGSPSQTYRLTDVTKSD